MAVVSLLSPEYAAWAVLFSVAAVRSLFHDIDTSKDLRIKYDFYRGISLVLRQLHCLLLRYKNNEHLGAANQPIER